MLRIDPFASTVSKVSTVLGDDLHFKLRNAVLGPDDSMYLMPCHLPSRILKLETPNPGRHTPLLTALLQPAQSKVLREGLYNPHYGPSLTAALHWEATRAGGNVELVNGLMEAAAPTKLSLNLSPK